MDTKTLFQLTTEMAAIEDALWESGGELTEEMEIAITETSESLRAKVDSYNGLIRSFESSVSILEAEIERLTKRKKAAQRAVENVKERILWAMDQNGIEKLDGAYCKMSRRRSLKTETNDEAMLSPYIAKVEELRASLPDYIQVGDLKVNKTVIKKMYKETGVIPAGAVIVENFSLTIR